MAREEGETKKPTTNRRIRKRLWCAVVVLIIALILLGLSWISGLWGFQSAEEKLAAIEAERAIPDEENAAVIYSQLLDDYDEGSLWPDLPNRETYELTRCEPWLSKDHPELADWLEEQQGTTSQLLEASKIEKCRFPISIDPQEMANKMRRLSAMRPWARLLVWAGNNDMAEGRVDAGLEKYLCPVQMGKHLGQQPVLVDYVTGLAVEGLGLRAIGCFIVEGDATETHLKGLEAALPQTKDNWSKDSSILREVERLRSKIRYSPLRRLVLFWRYRDTKTFERIHEIYARLLTNRRGNRILIALRRYKTKTGHWPKSLDEIQSSLSEEILTDPFSSGSFVYKLTDDSFKLYSRGENNVDEHGNYRGGADDWPIWPPIGRKTDDGDKKS